MMTPDVRLQLLIQQVRDLPALPDIALKVMRLAEDPRAGASDVARILSTDQALTARLLKLANSAFYGATRKISTVTDAVVLLGMRSVRNLATAISCQDLMEAPLSGYALRRGDLWRHSFCCAYAAQTLATRTHYRPVEEAFVGGLLHDIGKVILNVHLRAEFDEILRLAADGGMAFMDAEREILGFDHAEAGAQVLEKWNLPSALSECVRYHHMPSQQPERSPLTALVHVADAVCMTLGIGLGVDGLAYPLESGILDYLGITEADFEMTAGLVCEAAADGDSVFAGG